MKRCKRLLSALSVQCPPPIEETDVLVAKMTREFIDEGRDIRELPGFIHRQSWNPIPSAAAYAQAMQIANKSPDWRIGTGVVDQLVEQMKYFSIRPYGRVYIQLLVANTHRWKSFLFVLQSMEKDSIPHSSEVVRLTLRAIRYRNDINREQKFEKASALVECYMSDPGNHKQLPIKDVPEYLLSSNRTTELFDSAAIFHELTAMALTYEDAKKLQSKYELRLDGHIVTSLLRVCREEGNWKKALEVKEETLTAGLDLQYHHWTILIECFAKDQLITQALQQWREVTADGTLMPTRAYAAIINCCGPSDVTVAEEKFHEASSHGLISSPAGYVLLDAILLFYYRIGKYSMFDKVFSKCHIYGKHPSRHVCRLYRELPEDLDPEPSPPSVHDNENIAWLKQQTVSSFEDTYWKHGSSKGQGIGYIEVV